MAKKTAKKIIGKNTIKTVSKTGKSRGSKKSLVTVSGDQCFWVNNGPILSNLKDLSEALNCMTEDQWRHHVRRDQNDFAVWVKATLADEACARSLNKTKTKKEALKVVKSAVSEY